MGRKRLSGSEMLTFEHWKGGGGVRPYPMYLQYMPHCWKSRDFEVGFFLGWQLGLSRLVRRRVDLAAMFFNWGEEVVLWAGGMRRGCMSGEGGACAGTEVLGKGDVAGGLWGLLFFIRNLEGLVGMAGARFRGSGFMRFMPVISVCRDCSEGIGEGGDSLLFGKERGFAWIRAVLLDVEGLCAKVRRLWYH